MSDSIVPAAPSAMTVPAGFTPEQIDLIKRTVALGATDDELALFVHVSNKAGLDPFAKQIYAIKRWNADAGREVMTFQTGIDGFRLVASRTGAHAGTDDPVFDEKDGKPVKATVTVWKIVGGQRVSFTASARWVEYVQTKKDGTPTSMWRKMPYTMLGKCAEALALRKAFPADLSGIYAHEEMTQADGERTIPTVPVTPTGTAARLNAATAPAKVVDAVPAPASLVIGMRRDIDKFIGSGGASDLKAIAKAIGIDLTGRKPSQWSDEDVDRIWTSTPALNPDHPANNPPVTTIPSGSPEEAKFDA